MSPISLCDHHWYLDGAFLQKSVVCTWCSATVDDIPWDVDPFEYAARRFPSLAARGQLRRKLKPARVTR
jgi:hypothetical protein